MRGHPSSSSVVRSALRTALLVQVPLLVLVQGCVNSPVTEVEILARAQRIHKAALTLDTHKDIPDALAASPGAEVTEAERLRFRRQNDPTLDGDAQVDFPKMRRGGYDCGFFIVFVAQGPLNGGGFVNARRRAQVKFAAIERMATRYPEHIEIARTPDEVRRIHAGGKLVACIGIENGYPMGEDLGLIGVFHARGARYMGLAHTDPSQLADAHNTTDPMHHGLSDLGRQAVREMNRVGMMVDVSHSSKAAMLQAIEISKAPVIASHSACAALCGHSRNLDDEQLRALRQNGGVVQVVALASFVKDSTARQQAEAALRSELGLPDRGDPAGMGQGQAQGTGPGQGTRQEPDAPGDLERRLAEYRRRRAEIRAKHPGATVVDFVDHIDHAVKLIGIDHVAISSDFDGGGGIQGWSNAGETLNVTVELVRRGYTEDEINKLWSANTLRVWQEVQDYAAQLAGH